MTSWKTSEGRILCWMLSRVIQIGGDGLWLFRLPRALLKILWWISLSLEMCRTQNSLFCEPVVCLCFGWYLAFRESFPSCSWSPLKMLEMSSGREVEPRQKGQRVQLVPPGHLKREVWCCFPTFSCWDPVTWAAAVALLWLHPAEAHFLPLELKSGQRSCSSVSLWVCKYILLLCGWQPCPWLGGWNYTIFKAPSNLSHSMILVSLLNLFLE